MKHAHLFAAPVFVLAAVALAWGAEEAKKNLLPAPQKPESWRLEQHEGGKGKLSVDADAILIEATETTGTEWHVQAVLTGIDLKADKEYVLTYKAKASADRQIQVNALLDEDDYHPLGLQESVDLTKEYKEFKHEFKAENVSTKKKNRVSIIVGNEKGKVWVKDLMLTEK